MISNSNKEEEMEDSVDDRTMVEQQLLGEKVMFNTDTKDTGHTCTHKQSNDQDRPFSFVVAISSFLAQVMLGGYVYTGGIYYTIFVEEFEENGSMAVHWLCNLPITLWFFGSPLGSILTNKIGARRCSFFGGCLAFLGLSLCYFTHNFYIVLLCYGITAGFGHGIMYIGFITSVTRYFRKYRAMVSVLTTLGPMVGMAIYSYLIPYLVSQLNWRGSLLIIGGISLNICACACVLFPIDFKMNTRKVTFFSLLENRNFVLFIIQCVFSSLSSTIVMLHLPSLVISFGLGPTVASLSMTVFALSNSAAKIICSVVGHFIKADPATVYTGFLLVFSVSAALLPTFKTITWVIFIVTVVSFSFNVTGGHTFEVVLDLTGPDLFSNGVGCLQLGKAVGVIASGPFAGFLYGASGNYIATYYASGALMLTGCIIMFPVIMDNCRRKPSSADATSHTITVDMSSIKAEHTQEVESLKFLNKNGSPV